MLNMFGEDSPITKCAKKDMESLQAKISDLANMKQTNQLTGTQIACQNRHGVLTARLTEIDAEADKKRTELEEQLRKVEEERSSEKAETE